MRPKQITMSAFGPYAKKTVIDMDKLGTKGIYLITGDTGAGKTTIFDAISYALFGEASGDVRDASMFRSKYADKETSTFVELVFEYNGKEYKVKRNPEYMHPNKKGNGETKETAKAELILPDGSDVNKITKVNERIKELLGINKKQFSQICMIAQGDFRKLLDADTKSRIEIFRNIFKTENFKKIQDDVAWDTKKISGDKKVIKQSIDQYIDSIKCDETDVKYLELQKAKAGEMLTEDAVKLIESIIETDENNKKDADEKLENIDKDLKNINLQIETLKEQKKNKEQFEENEKKLESKRDYLEQAKKVFESEIEKQTDKKKLEDKAALINAKLPKFEELERVNKVLYDNTKQAKELQEKIIAAERNIGQLKQSESDYKKEQDLLKECNEKFITVKQQQEVYKTKAENINEFKRKFNDYNHLKKELEEKKSNAGIAIKESTRLNEAFSCKNDLFLKEQAGIIAQSLQNNKPCPVCGSLEHPSPAIKSDEAPTEADVKQAKKLADEATEKANSMSLNVKSLDGRIEELKNSLNQDGKKIIPDFELLTAKAQLVTVESENNSVLSEIKSQIEELKKAVERKDKIEKELPGIQKKISDIDTNLREWYKEHKGCETKAKEKFEQVKKIKQELEFESVDVAKKKISELKAQVYEIDKAYTEAQNEVNQTTESIKLLEGHQKGLKTALKTIVDYDEDALNSKYEELNNQKEKVTKIRDSVNSRITNNSDNLKEIKLKSKELIGLEKEYEWMNALSETLNGQITGKERIQLETYVQMSYFDRIINKANLRLLTMTDNQYELKRREENKNSGQVGLDLDVIDHYNGTVRSVSSLSGGESFKASLSLALGLSDEVQSSAGGIKIDTMFVDEGFGSLDEESLQQALKALIGLSDGNRLVGIISHVAALNERIDNKIIVKKEREQGSKITIEA